MSTDLGVEFFIKFDDLDPWRQSQCIFFVKKIRKDRRCKFDCHDIASARKLRQTILESESEDISFDDLIEYIRCNCCAGRISPDTNHRNSIKDVDLLIPLAKRWLDEILLRRRMDDIARHTAERPTPTTPARTSRADQGTPSSYASSATSTPTHTITVETPMTSPSYHRFSSPPPFNKGSKPQKPDASPTPASRYSTIPSATQHTSQHVGAHTRYDLRPREINPVTGNVSRLSARPALPRFRIYIESPSSEHAISWQVCQRLGAGDKPRDYETGSLYIYDRTSTPGYVKIGWTARSVKERLEDWSKCGYVPNELFRATEVPYAQRVETLTHHELVAEWRSEPPCQNCWARTGERVCHSEWFEVGHDRAIKVLSTWAKFFKKAIPYKSDGSLKTEWRRVVSALVAKGDNVTGTKLLEHHETSVKERETATRELVDRVRKLDIKGQRRVLNQAKEEPLTFKEVIAPKVEFEWERLSLHAPLSRGSSAQVDELPKDEPQFSTTPLFKFGLTAAEPYTGLFSFTNSTSSKAEPSSSQESPPKVSSSYKAGAPHDMSLQPDITWPLKGVTPHESKVEIESTFIFPESATKTDPPRREPVIPTQSPVAQRHMFKREQMATRSSTSKAQPEVDTSIFSKMESLPKGSPPSPPLELKFGSGSQSSTPFVFNAKPPSGSDQSSNSMQSALQPQTGWQFKTKTSPSHNSVSLPIVRFDNSTFPKMEFVFNTVPVKKLEPFNKPLTSLFGTLSITESAIEDKTLFIPQKRPEAGHLVKDASRNEELLPAQIPAPPSPILETTIEGRDTSVPCEKDVSDALDKLQLGEGDENCDSPTYSVTEQPSTPSKEMVKIGERKLQHKDVKPTTTKAHETESRVLDMNEKKPVDECQPILALELAALEIVDQLSSMAGVRSDTLADKSVVGLRVVEEKISPDIHVVSLA
ncbi:hypothetical protein GRF29_28g2682051 [Pseudopithomyces chartarum]|uniref:Bacteriophage T5 Orf172 DNA-binding domain-containing protein n=1 Tax=Pseudopithomyces chartarum TaxID=1892770 RepID=A0AAN6M438_9PLEO|nr:hypothetical protein GRF29_28g2682051 [Pseudopithomyces chartarum]